MDNRSEVGTINVSEPNGMIDTTIDPSKPTGVIDTTTMTGGKAAIMNIATVIFTTLTVGSAIATIVIGGVTVVQWIKSKDRRDKEDEILDNNLKIQHAQMQQLGIA